MALSNTMLDIWYGGRRQWVSVLLLPLAWLFHLLVIARRAFYRHLVRPAQLPCPVIVVGNINLGGSGKTPLLIALVKHLRQQGYSPGIVSRGYGSRAAHYPFLVTPETPVAQSGDEPLMIARRSGCPVMIGSNRIVAARKLIDTHGCNLILSDDGLQHYRLRRDVEIVVVDGGRLLGNQKLLPAGPLRESATRLRQADWIVVNGRSGNAGRELNTDALVDMQLAPMGWQRVLDRPLTEGRPAANRQGVERIGLGEKPPWVDHNQGQTHVHALAGIGNPQRFFDTLHQLGVDFIPHSFPDHHDYTWRDLDFADNLPVVMTEKDAVKCRALFLEQFPSKQDQPASVSRYWYLAVQADLNDEFYRHLDARLAAIKRGDPDQVSTSVRAGK